jgi:hypothetical protein
MALSTSEIYRFSAAKLSYENYAPRKEQKVRDLYDCYTSAWCANGKVEQCRVNKKPVRNWQVTKLTCPQMNFMTLLFWEIVLIGALVIIQFLS